MPERRPILALVAGAIALGISLVAVLMAAGGIVPVGPLTWATIALGAGGGLVVLLWPQQISALAIADALVAAATVASTFSLGVYELVPLVLLGAATLHTPHRPAVLGEPRHARSLSAPSLGLARAPSARSLGLQEALADPRRRSA